MDKPGEHYMSEISKTQKNNPPSLTGGNLKKVKLTGTNVLNNNTATESNGCFQGLWRGKGMSVKGEPTLSYKTNKFWTQHE